MRAIRAFTLERPGFAQKVVIFLMTLPALMVLGIVLAYWTWQWFAPQPVQGAPAAEKTVLVASAHGLFGDSPRDAGAMASTSGALRLLGVVAATDGNSGYAVLQFQSRDIRAVREGEELAAGIRLAEVHADHVILLRNGIRESLIWPQKDIDKNADKNTAKKP